MTTLMFLYDSLLDTIIPTTECMPISPEQQAAIAHAQEMAWQETIRLAELQQRIARAPSLHEQYAPGVLEGAATIAEATAGVAAATAAVAISGTVLLGVCIIIERVLYYLS